MNPPAVSLIHKPTPPKGPSTASTRDKHHHHNTVPAMTWVWEQSSGKDLYSALFPLEMSELILIVYTCYITMVVCNLSSIN